MPEHVSIPTQMPAVLPAAQQIVPVREAATEEVNVKTLQGFPVQRKLSVGTADDPLEEEADQTADKVMRMPAPFIQRKCAGCEEERVQRKPPASFIQRKEAGAGSAVSEAVANGIQASKGQGTPLPDVTKSFMESRFGADFSAVRIHSGSEASQLADGVKAQAFTVGNDIYFGEGKYAPATNGGTRLLAHELTHTVQQRQSALKPDCLVQRQPVTAPPTQAQLNQLCYAPGVPHPVPDAQHPELHPTYERWLHSFTGLLTSPSNDTVSGHTAANSFRVLGTMGRRFGTAGSADTEAVPVTSAAANGEEFIDHPTNDWVQNCLPANLRATAYQLPADCADVAVILRHVWLSAHHRTESIGRWTVGDAAGGANQAGVRTVISGIYSGNVAAMVSPYADARGNPLTNFTQLAPVLHPGDVLVWEHRETYGSGRRVSASRTGGHTQTINNITRTNGTITEIQVLQGNQPIFSDAATEILRSRGVARPDPNSAEGHRLRDLPGRRVESSLAISIQNITDPVTGAQIWGALDGGNAFTVLLAAGPPRAAARPAGAGRTRSVADWRPAIQRATADTMAGVVESMLQEARSSVEGNAGTVPVVTDMETLGRAAGEKLRDLNSHAVDRLIQSRNNITAILEALRDDANNVAAVRPLFDAFSREFSLAAVPQGTSVEGRRLFTENTAIAPFLAPFAGEVAVLAAGLRSGRNLAALQTAVTNAGLSLWQAATARAQATTGANIDDRPLYWTRQRMIEEIRGLTARFSITSPQRQALIDAFEQSSRGLTSVSFSGAAASQKKILISGFDPFGFNRPLSTSGGTDSTVLDSNPSGAAVLALDGQTISGAGGGSAFVQGVVFPVRYRDFDNQMIENFFRPFLTGTTPVSMIMTISQGGSSFEVEEWAGRRRSTAGFADNEGSLSGGSPANPVVPPGMAAGPEFLPTQLPHAQMTGVPQTTLRTAGRNPAVGTTGPAVTGTGGGFLSNEIFYRVRLLQTTIGGVNASLPVGHLHVPTEDTPGMTRDTIKNRIREIIAAALPALP